MSKSYHVKTNVQTRNETCGLLPCKHHSSFWNAQNRVTAQHQPIYTLTMAIHHMINRVVAKCLWFVEAIFINTSINTIIFHGKNYRWDIISAINVQLTPRVNYATHGHDSLFPPVANVDTPDTNTGTSFFHWCKYPLPFIAFMRIEYFAHSQEMVQFCLS